MRELGRWDGDLEMFVVDKPLEARMTHLIDLRGRAERGEFGYKPLSAPRGDNVFRLSNEQIRGYAMKQADAELKPSIGLRKADALMAHIAATGDY